MYMKILPGYKTRLKHRTLIPRANYAGRIWKRRVYSENAFKCFPCTLRRSNLKTQQSPVILELCFLEKLGEGNHIIMVAPSFSKSFFKMFVVHTKSRRFQIPPVSVEERFRKALVSWRISVDGRPISGK